MTHQCAELTRLFEAGQVDPESFGHRQHLLVAFDMLHQYEFLEAMHRYSSGIQALAMGAGVPEKFNVTITLAFLSIIAERIHRDPSLDFEAFMVANPDLESGNLLARWYSSDQLNSDLARTHFLLPREAA